MNGTLAKLMAQTDPKLYRKYLVDKKGKKVLYLHLQKALYGIMKRVLLFYRKLVLELKSMGFVVNPYDPCIANKIVDGQWLLNNKSGPTECTKLPAQPSQTAATKDTKQPSTHSSSNAPTLHQFLPLSSPTSASASLTRNLAYTERCVRGYTLSLLLAFCRDELPTK
jgi:hypothetical protein